MFFLILSKGTINDWMRCCCGQDFVHFHDLLFFCSNCL